MDQGKKVLFMTNNSSKTRAVILAKLHKLGFTKVQAGQVYTSGYATALFLKARGFSGKVFAAAGDGVCEELNMVGIETIGGAEFAKAHSNVEMEEVTSIQVDPDIRAVVTGWNHYVNYYVISYACLALQQGPDVMFLATNDDRLTPQGKEKVMIPGGGFTMSTVAHCSSCEPTVVGKPHQCAMDVIFENNPEISRERTTMVGDRLDTDIAFGYGGGVKTLLVFSGCTSPEQLATYLEKGKPVVPTYCASSIAGLCE